MKQEKPKNRGRSIAAVVGGLLLALGLKSSKEEAPPPPPKSIYEKYGDHLLERDLIEQYFNEQFGRKRYVPSPDCDSGYRETELYRPKGGPTFYFGKCADLTENTEIKRPTPSASEPVSELDL